MILDWSTIWLIALPPVAGGVIGYFTNDIAIKMLFRPYQAIKVAGRRLPFTPGLIPRNQDRLAHKVSDAILTSLLTPEELQRIAERLLQIERVQGVIRWLLQLALDQVKAEAHQNTAHILALLLHDFAGQSLPRLVAVQARRADFLEEQLDQIFEQAIADLQLSEEQAQQLSSWLLDVVFPPKTLRVSFTDFLTDRNIGILDAGFRAQSSGTYWLVANTVGAKDALIRLRTFLIEEPLTAQRVIADLLVSLNVRQRLTEWLAGFSVKNLPLNTQQELRRAFHVSVRGYTQTRGRAFLERLSDSWDWEKTAETLLRRLQKSEAVVASLDLISQELALILDRYLALELEPLVEKVIPILNLEQVIVDRVSQTPPAELEAAIQSIVKTELQAIVNLGGILGVVIGCMQALVLILQ